MTAPLDVYIHASGVVELRQPRALPPGEDAYIEAVCKPVRWDSWQTADPTAPALETRRWSRRTFTPIHGVSVWMEL